MMKKLTPMFLILTLVLGLGACGGGGQNEDGQSGGEAARVWKFAHAGANGDALDSYANYFKQRVEEEFDDVTIELYPAEQLGNDDERFELCSRGSTEFAMVATCFIGNVLPEAQVFGLSFMVPEDPEVAAKVFSDGQAVKWFDDKLGSTGLKAMDWYYEDFSCWTSNKPIRNLADLKGQKIRCMNSSIDIANVDATGANATPITFAEVYSALQLGTVNGQQNPIDIIYSMKFYEVQKYLTLSKHENVVDVILANKTFFENLPEEDQAKLEAIFKEVNTFANENRQKKTDECLQAIIESGKTEIIELSEADRAEIAATASYPREVFVNMTGASGQEILDLLLADIENFSK